MKVIADFHVHSHYSRATSKDLNLENLEKYGRIKGISLIGTGDFQHPLWLKELKEKLEEDGTGILKTKTGFTFILQTEISLIYTQGGKGRKVHNVVLAKNLDIAGQIQERLLKKGRLDYDGRPIFGMSCIEFVEMMKDVDASVEIIPAHIWTPWFSMFGSMSGFDSVEECFGDQAKHIHALETGLSSDPAMNWRLSQLDRYTLVSNSDAHSFWPWRLGRECNVFDIELSYDALIKALRTRKGFMETIEVDPNYGKYHFDGHRSCDVCMSPKESLKNKKICPKCRRQLTIGVLHRVEELADREDGFRPKNAIPFCSILPLPELIANVLGTTVATKSMWEEYYKLLKPFGTEMNVLLEAPREELEKYSDGKIIDAIIKNREGKIEIKPGYDGVYGEPLIGNIKKVEKNKEISSKKKSQQTGIEQFY